MRAWAGAAARTPLFEAMAGASSRPPPVLADVTECPVRVRGRTRGELAIVGSAAPATSPTVLTTFPAGAERLAVVRPAYSQDAAAVPLSDTLRPAGPDGSAGVIMPRECGTGAFVVDEYVRGRSGAVGQAARECMELGQHAVPLLSYLRAAGVPVAEKERKEFEQLPARYPPDERTAHPQSTNRVLMMAPTAFGFNADAAEDNYFMNGANTGTGAGSGDPASSSITQRAMREHQALWRALSDAGVVVSLWSHSAEQGTPDALFPNNWFSTHAATGAAAGRTEQATLALYPMKPPNRRKERRDDIVAWLSSRYGRVVDFSPAEEGNVRIPHADADGADAPAPAAAFLEGTGSLVLDHINRVAYVAASERSDVALASAWASTIGFSELVAFDATDADGRPIYHTNVVMSIGTSFAVVCAEAIEDDGQRERVLAHLRAGGKEVIQISRAQMEQFCGNVLELRDGRGRPILALSEAAHFGFTGEDRLTLSRHVHDFVSVPIPTIEAIGGGSVRCTLAELF